MFSGDWYLTGDQATRDADGYLWFVGRADDVIISAGYRIGPFEVESALLEHPAVMESAVVASPDADRGSIVKAFVKLRLGVERSERLVTRTAGTLQAHHRAVQVSARDRVHRRAAENRQRQNPPRRAAQAGRIAQGQIGLIDAFSTRGTSLLLARILAGNSRDSISPLDDRFARRAGRYRTHCTRRVAHLALSDKVAANRAASVIPISWWRVVVFAAAWTAIMFAYSPLARQVERQLEPDSSSQDQTLWLVPTPSRSPEVKLIARYRSRWVLGGWGCLCRRSDDWWFQEESILKSLWRRIVVRMAHVPIATAVAVCIAALGAGLIHFYQGPRAMVIITQLSILFGVLFVIGGYNLWTVMLCHGLYDTIAFIRFANKKSKYSNLDRDSSLSSGKQTIDAGLTL